MKHQYQNLVAGLAALVLSAHSHAIVGENNYFSFQKQKELSYHQSAVPVYIAREDLTHGIAPEDKGSDNEPLPWDSEPLGPGDRFILPGDNGEYYFNGHDEDLEGTFEGGESPDSETFRPDGVPGKIPLK